MIHKYKDQWEVDTQGLADKMFFSIGGRCGDIKRGAVAFELERMRGVWVISWKDACRIAVLGVWGFVLDLLRGS